MRQLNQFSGAGVYMAYNGERYITRRQAESSLFNLSGLPSGSPVPHDKLEDVMDCKLALDVVTGKRMYKAGRKHDTIPKHKLQNQMDKVGAALAAVLEDFDTDIVLEVVDELQRIKKLKEKGRGRKKKKKWSRN